MNTDITAELARQIVSEGILLNWRFYVVVILLSGIGAYIASFISHYAGKRGEQLATKADFESLREQVRLTTETTEHIKNDLQHEVWRKQQTESFRRTKLEEYLLLVYVAQEDLSLEMHNKYFYEKNEIDVHAINKAGMIQRLYFPELAVEHATFNQAVASFRLWMTSGMKDISERKRKGEQHASVSDAHLEGYVPLIQKLASAVSLVEEKTQLIAREVNA